VFGTFNKSQLIGLQNTGRGQAEIAKKFTENNVKSTGLSESCNIWLKET
jgi:hypothetical protein